MVEMLSTDLSQLLSMEMGISTDLENIPMPQFLYILKHRWLKTSEIYYLLNNTHKLFQMGFQLINDPSKLTLPPSGSFLIYKKEEARKFWKKDGHDWVKRKNTTFERDDTEKLRYNGEEKIKCVYCRGAGSGSRTSQTFRRRAYYLIQNPLYLLVHYLEIHSSKGQNKKKELVNEIPNMNLPAQEILQRTNIPNIGEIQVGPQFWNESTNPSTNHDIFELNMPLFQMEKEIESGALVSDNGWGEGNSDFFIPNPPLSHCSFNTESMHPNNTHQQLLDIFPSTNNSTQMGPDGGSQTTERNHQLEKQVILLTTRIGELENQIVTNKWVQNPQIANNIENHSKLQDMWNMNTQKIQNMQNMQNVQNYQNLQHLQNIIKQSSPQQKVREREQPLVTPEYIRSLNIRIVDFSPEWDYTNGGAKVLVCVAPSLENIYRLIENKLCVRFHDSDVPLTFVQGGVIKCHAPPHNVGFVKLELIYEGEIVSQEDPMLRCNFEYRQAVKHKKVTFLRARPDTDSSRDLESREFKIRIIERLTNLEHNIQSSGENSASNSNTQGERSKTKELIKLTDLNETQLDKLGKKSFLIITGKIFAKLQELFLQNNRYLEMIDGLDEYGSSLLHYFAALDYHEVVPIFAKYNANFNVATSTDLTPIIIAAARGHKKSVQELLKNGANIGLGEKSQSDESEWLLEEEKVNILEAAIQSKNHNILELLLRELTLNDNKVALEEGYKDPDIISKKLLFGQDEEEEDSPQAGSRISRRQFNKRRERINLSRSEMPRKSSFGGMEMGGDEWNDFGASVLLIQRNVRSWLLKRHYSDIKHASKILTSKLKTKIMNKTNLDANGAANLIQRAIRNWLNNKCD